MHPFKFDIAQYQFSGYIQTDTPNLAELDEVIHVTYGPPKARDGYVPDKHTVTTQRGVVLGKHTVANDNQLVTVLESFAHGGGLAKYTDFYAVFHKLQELDQYGVHDVQPCSETYS